MRKHITKILALLFALLIACMAVLACGGVDTNRQFYDNVQRFDEAIISLPDGQIVRGRVELWTDFTDGDQLQIRIDGVWYLTHSCNVVLIAYGYEN